MPSGRTISIWFACLSVLLLIFITAHLNPLGAMLAVTLTPLPVLLAGWRLQDKGALTLVLAGIAVLLALHPGLETLWQNLGFVSLLLLGLLLSVLLNRGLAPTQAIFVTVLSLSSLTLLVFLGEALYQGVSPLTLLAQRGAESMSQLRQMLGEKGASGAPLLPWVSQADAEALLGWLLPSMVVVNMGVVAWLNIVLVRHLYYLQSGQKPNPPLYQWALPEWLIFGVLGAGFMLLIPVAPMRVISLNLLLVLAALYFFQGAAVVSAWFNRLGLPLIVRAIGYPLMLYPLFSLIITLGVLDLWLDFRRLHQQPGDAGGGIQS